MQILVDKLKEEIVALSTKRKEDLQQQQQQQQQQQHRKNIDGQLVEDLQHRLMESENLIQAKSEQVDYSRFFFLIKIETVYFKSPSLSKNESISSKKTNVKLVICNIFHCFFRSNLYVIVYAVSAKRDTN